MVKNILKYSLSIFLAAFMLISATGITINKMICLSSGKVKVSLAEIADCCDPEETRGSGDLLKANCCDFSKTRISVDVEALKPDLSSLIKQFIALTGYLIITFDFTPHFFSSFIAGDLSPPLSGFEILKLIQVFLI